MSSISQPLQEQSSFALTDLIVLVWQLKLRVILLAALIGGAGVYYAMQLPKIYQSTATLLLSENQQNIRLPNNVAQISYAGDSKIDTYIQFIRSREFIGNLVDTLDLTQYEEFRSQRESATAQRHRNFAIDQIKANLMLSRVDETFMVSVRYESQIPEVTADIVNYIGPAFFAFHSDMTRDKAGAASDWLNKQLNELQAELSESERVLQAYMNTNELVDVRSQIDLVRGEIQSLLNEQMATAKQLSEKRVVVEQVRRYSDDRRNLMHVPWILNNPMVVEIRNRIIYQEQQLAEIAKRYKEKHHKYIAEQVKVDTLYDEQKLLLTELIQSLEQEYAAIERRAELLQTQIAEARARHKALGEHDVELGRLQRSVDSNQRLYNAFVSRLRETEILQDLGENHEFAVVEYASVPSSPSKPQVKLLAVVIAIFSLSFSAVFWLGLHYLKDKKTRLRNVLKRYYVPVLGEIPIIGAAEKTFEGIMSESDKNYSFSEAVRNLRTSIIVRVGEEQSRRIGITGVGKGGGKTTLSMALAKAFAGLEKTLLVDADLRNPSIGEAMQLFSDHPGLTHFVAKQSKFSECVFRASDTQLSVLSSGKVPKDPMTYISKPRFSNILGSLATFYERLIVETPTLDNYNDALIISRNLDGVLLVVDVDETDVDSLIDAIQKLRDGGTPLIGVIFNKVKDMPRLSQRHRRSRGTLQRLLPLRH